MTQPTFEYARSRGTINKVGQLNPLQRYAVPEEVKWTMINLAKFFIN